MYSSVIKKESIPIKPVFKVGYDIIILLFFTPTNGSDPAVISVIGSLLYV